MPLTKALTKLALRLLRILALAYVGLVVLMYFSQESLLFMPTKTPSGYNYAYDAEEVYLAVDGAQLHGLYFTVDEPQGLLLYFHGNAGNLEGWGSVCEELRYLNTNCLIFDYRGYGKSSGEITNKAHWFKDGQAMLNYAVTQADDLPIILYGRSVGTSIASKLAGKNRVQAVVLEASPYSFTEVAQNLYPYLPVKWFLKYDFENALYLATNQNPTLLLHGTQDEVVPYTQFEALKAKFPQYQTVSIPNGKHNDLMQYADYHQALKAFFSNLSRPVLTEN